MKKLDRLVTHKQACKKGFYRKLHRAVDEAAVQLQLPLRENTAPPAFKRLRKRGPQPWLGE